MFTDEKIALFHNIILPLLPITKTVMIINLYHRLAHFFINPSAISSSLHIEIINIQINIINFN